MNSLRGLRILNTRPLKQGKVLSSAITAAGGMAIDCPALRIVPKNKAWLSSLPDFAKVDQAIFVSANAADYCFSILAQEKRLWPRSIQVIAIGQATAIALNKYAVRVDLIPEIADSEHLLALTAMQEVTKKTILLFKGEGGRTLISETLSARGANLFIVEVYKRSLPKYNPQQLYSLWHNDAVDIILFTSQQTMDNIFTLFGGEAHAWLCSKPCLVVSERLAKEASLLGMQTIIITKPQTILDTLHQFNQGLIHGQ
jgi:uroporphyrinogen-III synthase